MAKRVGRLVPRTKLWLEIDGRIALSDWRVRLVEARTGVRVLETASGGAAGGGRQLTPEGRDLVRRYHAFAAGVTELAERQLRTAFQ